MPVFIIAQPLAEAAVHDVVLYDVRSPKIWGIAPSPAQMGSGVEILDRFKTGFRLCLMIAVEAGDDFEEWRETLIGSGDADPQGGRNWQSRGTLRCEPPPEGCRAMILLWSLLG